MSSGDKSGKSNESSSPMGVLEMMAQFDEEITDGIKNNPFLDRFRSTPNIEEIPLCDLSTFGLKQALFEQYWPILKEVSQQPLERFLPIFYSRDLAKEEEKWVLYQQLTNTIRSTRQPNENISLQTILMDIVLYAKRAIIGMQCGFHLSAVSDVMTLISTSTYFDMQVKPLISDPQEQENTMKGLGTLFQQHVKTYLMQTLSMMLWGDMAFAKEGFVNFLNEVIEGQGNEFFDNSGFLTSCCDAIMKEIPAGTTTELITSPPSLEIELVSNVHCEEDGSSTNHDNTLSDDNASISATHGSEVSEAIDIEKITNIILAQSDSLYLANVTLLLFLSKEFDDKYSQNGDKDLIAALLVIHLTCSLGSIKAAVRRNAPQSVHDLVTLLYKVNPLSVFVMQYFYRMHEYNVHNARLSRWQEKKSKSMQDSNLRDFLLAKEYDVPKHEKMRQELGFDMPSYSVPLQYRDGVGGDRDPNNVLRTLFAYRRDEMKNVRVCVDREKGGFKLVSKKAIRKGEVFLVEKPFASFNGLATQTSHVSCAYCYEVISNSIWGAGRASSSAGPVLCRCKGCGECYCNEECRQAAFDSYHKKLCTATPTGKWWAEFINSLQLSNNQTNGLLFNACLVGKLMVMAECRGLVSALDLPEIKILRSPFDSREPIASLPNGPEMKFWWRGGMIRRCFEDMVRYCRTLFSPNVTLLDFVRLHAIITQNVIGGKGGHAGSSDTGMIDTNVLIAASFANHSCTPNTSYLNESSMRQFTSADQTTAFMFMDMGVNSPAISFKAKQPIAEGEEITISYVDDTNDVNRKRRLLMDYGIHESGSVGEK